MMLIGSSRSCVIPIPLVPKARPRVDKTGTHMPAKYRQCLRDVGMILATVYGNDRGWPTHQAYAVELVVNVGPHGGDVDNLLGTILDAGNGIMWDDDRQVVKAMVQKFRWAGESWRVHVHVTILDGAEFGTKPSRPPTQGTGRGGRERPSKKRPTSRTNNSVSRAHDAGKGPSRGSKAQV